VSTLDRLVEFLRKLWGGASHTSRFKARPLPPITYPKLNVVRQSPRNQEIAPGSVTVVAPRRRAKWALFLCPCGCECVITLPLQTTKRPHWGCHKSRAGRPTLHPSIWRDVGCLSHFIIDDGRVFWCGDNGISPDDPIRQGVGSGRTQVIRARRADDAATS